MPTGWSLDTSAFEQFAGFLKTYLRRKRLKHTAEVTTVRRDGRMMGQRLDATARPGEQTRGHRAVPDAPQLAMTMFTGDTRDAAVLFGKRKFDAIVTDAPYGVVHGATDARRASRENGKRGSAGHPTGHRPGGDRDRSPPPCWPTPSRSGPANCAPAAPWGCRGTPMASAARTWPRSAPTPGWRCVTTAPGCSSPTAWIRRSSGI